MPWVMTTLRTEGPPREYHVYIGAVKIAEMCFKRSTKDKPWLCYMRLMYNHISYDIKDNYPSMSEAYKDLHRMLNSPSPDGAS